MFARSMSGPTQSPAPHQRPVMPVVVSAARAELGEGPYWRKVRSELLWVDIKKGTVWSLVPGRQPSRLHKENGPVSAVAEAAAGTIVVVRRHSAAALRPGGDLVELFTLPGEPSTNRCNDAKCDPWGNLWIGTMDETESQPSGNLWRLARDGLVTKVLSGVYVANTLAWDAARHRFYLADSRRGEICSFDHDPDTGVLSNQRLLLAANAAPGTPDGSAIDEFGNLWNARWDGGCVIEISPEGRVVRSITVPAQRPTSCAFGGQDGTTLFVTSAAAGLANDEDGNVFALQVGVAGGLVPAYQGPIDPGQIRVELSAKCPAWNSALQ